MSSKIPSHGPPAPEAKAELVTFEPSFELSPHELERFGVPAARAFLTESSQVRELDAFCAANGVRMAIVRCSADRLDVAQAVESSGAALMDCLVYYRHGLAAEPDVKANDFAFARAFEERDRDAADAIAGTAFQGYSGHYHADPRLDRAAADDGYRDWARQSCKPDNAIVAEGANGVILGFASFRPGGDGIVDAALFAVAPAARGKGIFHLLLQSAAHWAWKRGARACTYSTQITNVAANRAVVKNGFEFDYALYTFHKWYD